LPDVATTRTRDITLGVTGTFGRDSAAVFGGPVTFFRLPWLVNTEVDYWGLSARAQVDPIDPTGSFAPPVLHGPDPGAQPAGTAAFWLTIVRDVCVKIQKFYVPTPASWDANSWQAQGSYSLSETVHAVQHVNPNPTEVMATTAFTMTGSVDITIIDTAGGASTTGSSGSLTMTMTEAAAAGISIGTPAGYGYRFRFTGVGVHFDTTCGISFSGAGLISARTGISTTFGNAHLTGSGASCTFHWSGGEGTLQAGWNGSNVPAAEIYFEPSWALSVTSNVYRYGDGSEVGATLQHWYGSDHVGDFTSGGGYQYPGSGLIDYLVLNSFDSGQSRPGDGWQPGSPVPSDPNYNSLGGLAGGDYAPIGHLFEKPGDPAGGDTTFRISPTWANGYGTYTPSNHPTPPGTSGTSGLAAKVMPPYLQGTVMFASQNSFGMFENNAAAAGGPRWIADASGPTFPGASAPWDAAPSVSLVSGAGIDGNAIRVVSTGMAAVGASQRYLLLHQGFRYARLRCSGSPPSTTTTGAPLAGDTDLAVASSAGFQPGDAVTVGPEVGTVASVSSGHIILTAGLATAHPSGTTVSRSTAGAFLFALSGSGPGTVAWRIVPPPNGATFDAEIDLTKPEYRLNTASNAWEPATARVAPAEFAPDPVPSGGWFGAEVAVLPLTAGTYLFDHLQGYLKTDGTHTGVVLLAFLDGRGDTKPLGDYDRDDLINPQPTDGIEVFTWIVNGMRGATVTIFPTVQTSVAATWQHFKTQFDTATLRTMPDGHTEPNDTGIAVVIGTAGSADPLAVFGPANQGRFAFAGPADQPAYGFWMDPDAPTDVQGQLREVPTNVVAYYGCGDMTAGSGGYSATVQISLDWLFDGEAIINAGGSGRSITLNDNDSGAALATAVTDDDGMARLAAHYGVFYPYDNVDGSQEWTDPPPPPSTTLTAGTLPGDTVVHVADVTGFHVADVVDIGAFGGDTRTITAITTGQFTITPAMAGVFAIGDPVSAHPSTTIGYTPLGMALNFDWLSGGITPVDSEGYWPLGTPPARAGIVILDRYQTFLMVVGKALGRGVWNMHDRVGGYHRADVSAAGAIRYHRSDLSLPPFAIEVDATTGTADSEPRMSMSGIDRILLLFSRDPDVMLTWSDDDGATWSDPMALFTGGKHPANAPTDIGTVIHAALVGGQIQAKEEFAPEQWSAPWTFVDASGTALAIDDDSFSFTLAKEGAARHVLVATAGGNVSEWVSADDARTWELVT